MEKIDALAAWYLLIFGVFLPYLAFKSARAARTATSFPPRTTIWRSVLILESLMLFVALIAAWAARIDVFAVGQIDGGALAATGAMLGVALLLQQVIWRYTDEELARRLLRGRPREAREMGWWTLVSLAAGVVEEIAYRGVLPSLLLPVLERWTGGASPERAATLGGDFTAGWWIAVCVSVAAFVLGHPGQGWGRAAFFTGFAVGCHVLVRTTGSLYPAIVIHFVYDFMAGLTSMRFARRLSSASNS